MEGTNNNHTRERGQYVQMPHYWLSFQVSLFLSIYKLYSKMIIKAKHEILVQNYCLIDCVQSEIYKAMEQHDFELCSNKNQEAINPIINVATTTNKYELLQNLKENVPTSIQVIRECYPVCV